MLIDCFIAKLHILDDSLIKYYENGEKDLFISSDMNL